MLRIVGRVAGQTSFVVTHIHNLHNLILTVGPWADVKNGFIC